MTIINAIIHFFELYPDFLIVPVALAHVTYGWLTEGDLFTTIAQGLVGAAIGFVFAALFTLADRLFRNGQNQFVFRDEVYLLMISTLLRHINDSDVKGGINGKA